jgi:integrase
VSLKALGRKFAGQYLDHINKTTLYEFEQMRRSEGVTTATIRRDLTCLSSLMSSAVEWDWIEINPVRSYMSSRRKRGGLTESPPRTRYLSHEEEAALISAAANELGKIIGLAIDTGLRREELFSLTWKQIDLVASTLRTTTDTKTGTVRTVPLLPRAANFLSTHPRNIRSPYVFCNASGQRYGSRRKGFENAAAKAGITDIRWHDLRRTCGCRLLQDHGLRLEEVRLWLGHSSIAVTEQSYAFLEITNIQSRMERAQKQAQGHRIIK